MAPQSLTKWLDFAGAPSDQKSKPLPVVGAMAYTLMAMSEPSVYLAKAEESLLGASE